MVTVYGVDHPGIVHAAPRARSPEPSVNITDLNTRLVADAGGRAALRDDDGGRRCRPAVEPASSSGARGRAARAEGVEVSLRELEQRRALGVAVRDVLRYPAPRAEDGGPRARRATRPRAERVAGGPARHDARPSPAASGSPRRRSASWCGWSVVDVTEHPKAPTSSNGRLVLVNPRDRARGGRGGRRARAASRIPDLTANVRRATRRSRRRRRRRPCALESEGFEARCLLHEIDHLDGLLFLDRVDSLRADVFRRKRYSLATGEAAQPQARDRAEGQRSAARWSSGAAEAAAVVEGGVERVERRLEGEQRPRSRGSRRRARAPPRPRARAPGRRAAATSMKASSDAARTSRVSAPIARPEAAKPTRPGPARAATAGSGPSRAPRTAPRPTSITRPTATEQTGREPGLLDQQPGPRHEPAHQPREGVLLALERERARRQQQRDEHQRDRHRERHRERAERAARRPSATVALTWIGSPTTFSTSSENERLSRASLAKPITCSTRRARASRAAASRCAARGSRSDRSRPSTPKSCPRKW